MGREEDEEDVRSYWVTLWEITRHWRKDGTARRGRRRKQLLDNLKGNRWYWNLKQKTLDSALWQNRFMVRTFLHKTYYVMNDRTPQLHRGHHTGYATSLSLVQGSPAFFERTGWHGTCDRAPNGYPKKKRLELITLWMSCHNLSYRA